MRTEAGRKYTADTHVGEDNVGDGVRLSLEGLAEGLVAGNEILEGSNRTVRRYNHCSGGRTRTHLENTAVGRVGHFV